MPVAERSMRPASQARHASAVERQIGDARALHALHSATVSAAVAASAQRARYSCNCN